MTLRVGFVSTAKIGSKNLLAIRAAKDVEVVAVSSRSVEKAEQWAKAKEVPKFYGSHDELLADVDIDAVYIPLPTGVRADIVIAAAKAGKHVLCEKPIAPTAEAAAAMITACQENGVVFMDGVMFMHNPRLDAMRAVLESPGFGQVKRVCSDFSFNGGEEFKANNIRGDRLGPTLEPLGSLGDLGWYNVRFAMFAFQWAMPTSVSAVAHTMRDGVPVDISGVLTFGEGKCSIFSCSFEASFNQTAKIVGTEQTIEVDDFCLSGLKSGSTASTFRLIQKHGLTQYDMLPEREVVDQEVTHASSQEVNMWEKFAELCRTKNKEQMQFYADVSLNTQKIMDAIMESARQGGTSISVAADAASPSGTTAKTEPSISEFLQSIAPCLDGKSHKGSSGRIGVLGGSVDFAGAPYYAGMASLRVGAELLYLCTAAEATGPIKSYSPELMVSEVYRWSHMSCDDAETVKAEQERMHKKMSDLLPRLHALVIGPGLGRDDRVLEAVKRVILSCKEAQLPIVIDADGLWLIERQPQILKGYETAVLTPNSAELRRLSKALLGEESADPQRVCDELGGPILLQKGRVDHIYARGQAPLACAEQGTPRRPGGLGDFLSGSLGTLIGWAHKADKDKRFACVAASTVVRRACKAAYLKKKRSMVAPDVLDEVGDAFDALCPVCEDW